MTIEGRNKKLFDALLKISISEALKDEMDALPSNEELNKVYKPSPELDKRIRKSIIKKKVKTKVGYYVKNVIKVAVCIIIIVALSPVTLPGVAAARKTMLNAFIDWYEEYTEIQFKDSTENSDENKNVYHPAYLPEGFQKESVKTYGNTIMQKYSNESGDEISLKQWPADAGTVLIDNENKNYSELEISGNKAYLFQGITEDEQNVLLWQCDDQVFELTSLISSDELIQIGNSLEK